ncbi:MAG: DUF4982 domain-containing protein [Treponema sp.]|jgi:beta-galactosidase|nr:DUF4982 domain-containing protein [Treponema sp.]
MNFNNNWKFILGNPKNAQSENFDDRTWKQLDLPHDWVISQPFDKGKPDGWTAQNMQGFFSWQGISWYRKEFFLDSVIGKAVFIYFGGAYRNSKVFVNGKEAGGRASGYSSFELDITDFVKDGKNLIAVQLDNGCEEPDRWYSGSGLYRNVVLKVVPLVHIKTWGVQIDSELSKNLKQADITVKTAVISKDRAGICNANLKFLNPDGSLLKEVSIPFNISRKEELKIDYELKIKNPLLWSSETPNLYTALIYIDTNGEASEPVKIKFGIRNIEIAYKKGMTVNGQKIKLKGVCLHHEAGITGSAYYDDVWRRRLNILKSIGCNAIRTSHNLPAEEFLDLCDELGFYVVDECFDKWKSGYYASHFDTDAERDLTDMILRDRNHPCIFMWSIGNEVENQGQESMIAIQKQLAGIVRKLDSRPITCALAPHANPRSLVNAPAEELVKITKTLAKDVDILGLNYHEPLYQHYTQAIDKPILGTECYEYYSSVGTNFEDVSEKNPWQFVLENDNVIGQFIWAGIDYLGESSWPAKGWTGSILDICGFLKPNAFFRKSIWLDKTPQQEPFIYLAFYDQFKKNNYARGRWSFPQLTSHLNHEYFKRTTVKAAVFTNCDESELYINSKKMGRRKKSDFENGIIEYTFEYHTGIIEIKGIQNGKETCSYTLKTAEQPQKINLIADSSIQPGGVAHVEVNIADKNNNICANDESLLEFSLEGDGEILGACSGDLTQNLGFTQPKTNAFEGKALVLIKAGESTGELTLTAYSENLEKNTAKIKVGKK